MQSESETVADITAHYRAVWQGCEGVSLSEYEGKDVLELVDRFESAWRREKEHQAVHNCEIRAKSGLCGLKDEIKAHQREVAKLREFAEFVEELYCGCTCKTTNEEREDGCCNQCEFGEKLRKALQGGEK